MSLFGCRRPRSSHKQILHPNFHFFLRPVSEAADRSMGNAVLQENKCQVRNTRQIHKCLWALQVIRSWTWYWGCECIWERHACSAAWDIKTSWRLGWVCAFKVEGKYIHTGCRTAHRDLDCCIFHKGQFNQLPYPSNYLQASYRLSDRRQRELIGWSHYSYKMLLMG